MITSFSCRSKTESDLQDFVKKKMKKIHFECSKCGAGLNIDNHSKIIKCEYCGKKYLFKEDSDNPLIQEKLEISNSNSGNKSNLNLKEKAILRERGKITEGKNKSQGLVYGFTSFAVILLIQFVVFIVLKIFNNQINIQNWYFWSMPFLMTFLTGIICPAMGTFFVSKKSLLKPYSLSLAVLPAFSISLGLGVGPFFLTFLYALIISLAFEMPYYQRGKNKIEVMIAIFTAIIGSVVLISYLGKRIHLESLLFGDLLTGNSLALKMVLTSSTAFILLIIFGNERFTDKKHLNASRNIFSFNLAFIFISSLLFVGLLPFLGAFSIILILLIPSSLGIVNRSSNLKISIIRSSLFGLVISISGFLLSFVLNLPPGPVIGTLFCVSALAKL